MMRSDQLGASGGRRPWPLSLPAGAALIVLAELLLIIDVRLRGGAIVPYQSLDPPAGSLQIISRWAAINMTPVCWIGFLLMMDGLLTILARRRTCQPAACGSPARSRPRRFILCFVLSVPIWLFFDWMNFSFMDAWRYHGLPESLVHRSLGYFVAFGAICPGMFLTAELYQQVGLRRLRGPRLAFRRVPLLVLFILGLAFLIFPFIARNPTGSLTLWLAPVLLLDPLNHALGGPSMAGDFRAGRWGRMVALMAGGLTCGLLWEFWNYFAAAKWTYNLPFLGPLEGYRYFEMPLAGLPGFLPFGVAVWDAFQLVITLLKKIGLNIVEPLPTEDTVL
jgi:hypothetical protein